MLSKGQDWWLYQDKLHEQGNQRAWILCRTSYVLTSRCTVLALYTTHCTLLSQAVLARFDCIWVLLICFLSRVVAAMQCSDASLLSASLLATRCTFSLFMTPCSFYFGLSSPLSREESDLLHANTVYRQIKEVLWLSCPYFLVATIICVFSLVFVVEFYSVADMSYWLCCERQIKLTVWGPFWVAPECAHCKFDRLTFCNNTIWHHCTFVCQNICNMLFLLQMAYLKQEALPLACIRHDVKVLLLPQSNTSLS